jgi:thioredoxin reductase/ferredoxin
VTWVVPLALGGLAILLMAVFTMVSARKRHHATVAPAQVVGPRVLVHDINDDRCTGCDACVAVCPTNVLDLVANKSRVLRFHDCIQCEACMFACPTEALVMYPEGGHPPPLKVPEIDENFQTAVPGQYLIGEVAGKPLVKNAANLGRAVIEHMLSSTMLRVGALGRADNCVDVAIIGSGPGGLAAALSCIQRGVSYVVLEKEQLIASTIARYPKGKLVMAEPYESQNVSLLPVFDSSKEQLIPIWKELIERVGLKVNQGESVESVTRLSDGNFEVRSTVATYRAQRVVLSIGTRGKPRTLQVPGENLPKIFNLLEDPDDWRGRAVLVIGGGDSACEAALALADAGARVMISYRGKTFSRAQPKNKAAIESYSAEGRIKAKLGSQVLAFEPESVVIGLADGTQKRYPNEGAFVLIGADPPIAWLEKLGVRFIERPHQYAFGKSDDIVRKFVRNVVECPEDAARAAAQVLGGVVGLAAMPPPRSQQLPMPMGEPVSGPRKWLRSATSIFSTKGDKSFVGPPPTKTEAKQKKKFDAPVPLSEFAKRKKTKGDFGRDHTGIHTGHGRRDQLSAGERTRILRMLRDEGGRLADEDSQVYIGAAPAKSGFDFDLDDSPAPAPMPARPDIPAKPAVVVGLAQARRQKRPSVQPEKGQRIESPTSRRMGEAPTQRAPIKNGPPPLPGAAARMTGRRPVPAPFGDEPTRQVDDKLLQQLRSGEMPAQQAPAHLPPSAFEEPTRLAPVDPLFSDTADDHMTRPGADGMPTPPIGSLPLTGFEDNAHDEATKLASLEGIAAMERANRGQHTDPERTRAVDIRNDQSISDVDWDLD